MRASFIIAAAAIALAAPASADPIKVGAIITLSGPDAAPGEQIDRGLKLYLDEHSKDLPPGVSVELVTRDDTGPNPDIAKRLAQELVTREHVQFLTGVIWTPNAAAIAPIATEAKVPFIVSNAAGVSIPRLSPYIVRVSFTLWQTAYPLGAWAAKKGLSRGYSMVADYAPGVDAENGFAAGFTENGGTMLGKGRFPVGDLNFTPYLQRLVDSKPQTAYIFAPVSEAVAMMSAVQTLGFTGRGITLVSTMDLVPDEQLPAMGDAALGLITSGNYSAIGKRPQNEAFVAAWKRAYGPDTLPDFTGVQGWDSMAAIFAAIEATGGKFDGDQAMAILNHWQYADSPRGPISIDPATRDVIEDIYIRRVERVNGTLANAEFETIPDTKDPWKERNPPK